jgi:hypothetical protein
MGKKFIRSTITRDEAITASVAVPYDLPVNPLSFIIYTMAWRDGAAIGNTASPIADALSFISRIDVLLDGAAIYSLNGADSFYMSHFVTKKPPHIINLVDAATEQHYLTWLIPFGRKLYAEKECLMATTRGKLRLEITATAAVGTVDTPTHTIESVELPEASPDKHLKIATLARTPTAAGENEVDLPLGNEIVGLGMFATTVPTGVSADRSIGEFTLLKDDQDFDYTRTNWESFHSEAMMNAPMQASIDRHTHAQAAGADVVTGQQLLGVIGRNRMAYIDFDPTEDGMYILDTKGMRRLHLRVNSEGVTTAYRILPVELLPARK